MGLRRRETEVLVVGAGPVGLFGALVLADRGVSVKIIEEQWKPAARSYALALHADTIDLLARHDLAEELLERGHRVPTVAFHDRGGLRTEMSLARLDKRHPFLLVVPQRELESLLASRLAERKIQIEWNHRLDSLQDGPRAATARLQRLGKASTGYGVAGTEWSVEKEFDVDVHYVIGADGSKSGVRRELGIDFEPCGDPETYAVFEFDTNGDCGDTVRFVMEDDRTSVFWPMGRGRCRWSFRIEEGEIPTDPRVKARLPVQIVDEGSAILDAARLEKLLGERAPWFETGVKTLFWSAAIRFERRLAGRFGAGRAWLAGDAAHLAAPLGMQSMNVGLREVEDLAERIAAAVRGQAGPETFTEYEEGRLREWRQLQGLEGPPETETWAVEWVRQRAGRFPLCTPASGGALRDLLAQIGVALPPI